MKKTIDYSEWDDAAFDAPGTWRKTLGTSGALIWIPDGPAKKAKSQTKRTAAKTEVTK